MKSGILLLLSVLACPLNNNVLPMLELSGKHAPASVGLVCRNYPMGCIYLATNRINGKQYVGKTERSMEDRRRDHLKDSLKSPRLPFQRALRKYGADSFDWDIIQESNCPGELNRLEVESIVWFGSKVPNGYNMTDGGEGTGGLRWRQESRLLASSSAKRRGPRKQGVEERQQRRILMRGNHYGGGDAIRESNRRRKGEKRGPEAILRIKEGCKKRPPVTDTTKELLRKINTGKKCPVETRRKIGLITSARKGVWDYHHSQKTINLLRNAAKNRDPEVCKRIGRASGKTRMGKKRGPYKKRGMVCLA